MQPKLDEIIVERTPCEDECERLRALLKAAVDLNVEQGATLDASRLKHRQLQFFVSMIPWGKIEATVSNNATGQDIQIVREWVTKHSPERRLA